MSTTSSESGDSDTILGWTLVNSVGDSDDGQAGDTSVDEVSNPDSVEVLQEEQASGDEPDEPDEVLTPIHDSPEKAIEDVVNDGTVETDGASEQQEPVPVSPPEAFGHPKMCTCGRPVTSGNGSDRSSDIELIPDDASVENGSSAGSAYSQYSLLEDSVVSAKARPGYLENYYEELDRGSDISALSSVSRPTEKGDHVESEVLVQQDKDDDLHTDLSSMGLSQADLPIDLTVNKVRSYTHTPNSGLNVWLNILLVMSVAMVFGLGFGHFLGWSSRWIHKRQLHKTHLADLIVLQGEVQHCNSDFVKNYVGDMEDHLQFCFDNVDDWQSRFDDILAESSELQKFVDQVCPVDEYEKCVDPNSPQAADFYKFNVHFLRQNISMLIGLRLFKDAMPVPMNRVMELENKQEELLAAMALDRAQDAEDQKLIRRLAESNLELRKEINSMREAFETDEEGANVNTLDELSTLRQKIDQLKTENDELKQTVANLRFSQPIGGSKDDVDTTQPPPSTKIEQDKLPNESNVRDGEESHLLDSVLTSWLLDSVDELDLTGFLEYLTKVATDKPTAQREIQQLRDNLLTGYDQLSKQARAGLDGGRRLVARVQEMLRDKWLQTSADDANARMPTEAILAMTDAIRSTLDRVYKMGTDMLEPQGTTSKLQKQVDKMVALLENRWDALYSQVWGTQGVEEAEAWPSKKDEFHDYLVALYSAEIEKSDKIDDGDEEAFLEKLFPGYDGSEHRHVGDPHEFDERSLFETKTKGGKELLDNGMNMPTERDEHVIPETVDEVTKVTPVASDSDEMDKASCPKTGESENASQMFEESGQQVLVSFQVDDDEAEDVDKVKPKTDKDKVDAENATSPGDWVFERANGRKSQRHSKRRSDWVFERAQERQNARKDIERAEWYFDRAKGRYKQRTVDRKQKSDKKLGKKQEKLKKKQDKLNKRQKIESDSDSDDDLDDRDEQKRWSKYEQRRQRYGHHNQAFDWAVPDLRNYHYSY